MSIDYNKDDKGIVTLTMNKPGSSVNLVDEPLVRSLSDILDRLDSDKNLSGIIITSSKKDFLSGADIDKLFAITDPDEAMEMADFFKKQLRRLELLGKPAVAAINGSALGGGYELALACNRRIAVNSPSIEIGFPEVTLGLLPGGGGTQRLPRLIGIQNAISYLLEGKRVRPADALKPGLIDEVAADQKELMEKAHAWIKNNPEVKQPWDIKDFKWPGGDPRNPKMGELWAIAPSMVNKKARGNYPAVRNILSCLYEGAMVDIDTALRIESRYFANLAVSSEAKNLISALWFQLNSIKKGQSRPKGSDKYSVKKVGILGAGMMGAGIAYVSAYAGIEVVLKDVNMEAAERGRAYSEKILEKRTGQGKMTKEKMGEILSRIKPTDMAVDLKGCDLVIEAVFEDRELKGKVTREAETEMLPDGVFASNTSTLPITGLAEKSSRPERFIGLHFFSPADKMPLVEIIVGKKTSDETLARAFDYVLQIKKTPIVVNDSRGFYTSRVFSTYVTEGIALLSEGVNPMVIESAGLKAGMPVGPLALSDEVSLSLMKHIMEQTKKDLEAEGKPVPQSPRESVIKKMVDENNRPGKKEGRGFYDYTDKAKSLWPGLGKLFPLVKDQPAMEEIIDRMIFIQTLETIRCYEEKVLRSVADANIGSIFGWGFPPFRGGTLQFASSYGIKEFLNRSRELEKKYGPRFAPPSLLVKMAEKNEVFK